MSGRDPASLSRDERRQAGTRLCRQLAEWIGQKTTPGLGRWTDAWEIVAKPADRFMDALRTWEASGAPEDWETLDEAYLALAAAWREADRRFLDVSREEALA